MNDDDSTGEIDTEANVTAQLDARAIKAAILHYLGAKSGTVEIQGDGLWLRAIVEYRPQRKAELEDDDDGE